MVNLCMVACSQKVVLQSGKTQFRLLYANILLAGAGFFPIIGFCVDFQHEKIDIFARELLSATETTSN